MKTHIICSRTFNMDIDLKRKRSNVLIGLNLYF